MKFSTVLSIAICVAAVFAAPHHGSSNHEVNKNYEDNSNHANKEIGQTIGSVGSSRSGGLLGGGILAGGVLSETTNNNDVNQNAKIN